MLLGHDGGDRAAIHVREMGVVHLVRVCVLGEMGVVAAVIVVVVVVFVIVVEVESSNFKGLEKERVFLILGNPGFNGFVALTRYCGFLLFGFEEDEVGLLPLPSIVGFCYLGLRKMRWDWGLGV